MTENADVEWLRTQADEPQWLTNARARRLLAHIDQLESERVKDRLRIEALQASVDGCAQKLAAEVSRRIVPDDRRPTIHEIAAQIYAPMMRGMEFAPWAVRFAEFAYDAAEALMAEGRRRDEVHR
jgi:hypothetical protein